MVRRKLLLATLIAVLAQFPGTPAAGFASEVACSLTGVLSGSCTAPTAGASTDGQSVSVRAEQSDAGNTGATRDRGAASPRRGGAASAKEATHKKTVRIFARGKVTDLGNLPALQAPGPAPCSPCTAGNFTVTVSDLVNFTPSAPVAAMEPNGWAVVRVPANFIAQSSPEVHTGPLLGSEAEVRFAPLGFVWNYGDGIRRSTATAGQTWQLLGVPEFSETTTSHAYTLAGRFVVQVEASFTAEYRFAGQDWNAVSGIVTATSKPLDVVVGQAKTVLVSKDCAVDRRGPGC